MRYLVAEDEPYTFESTCRVVREVDPEADVVTHVTDTAGLREALRRQEHYEVALVDIHLEDGLCFDAFAGLQLRVPLIFLTAYDQYALEAFQSGGLNYLLKPLDADELGKALHRARMLNMAEQELAAQSSALVAVSAIAEPSRVVVTTFDGDRLLQEEEISHFSTRRRHAVAWLTNGECLPTTEPSLDALESLLSPAHFFRANRQYIVKAGSVQQVKKEFGQRRTILLRDYPDLSITVSKQRVALFLQWLQQAVGAIL